MTEFTTRNPGLPPTRTKPGTMGKDAATKGARTRPGGPGPSAPRGGVTSPSRLTAPGGGQPQKPVPQPPEESDFRHAVIAAQFQNMRQLGRDIPFGVYLIRNGHHRELVNRPFDLFLDS